jgi:hypothetical protein
MDFFWPEALEQEEEMKKFWWTFRYWLDPRVKSAYLPHYGFHTVMLSATGLVGLVLGLAIKAGILGL